MRVYEPCESSCLMYKVYMKLLATNLESMEVKSQKELCNTTVVLPRTQKLTHTHYAVQRQPLGYLLNSQEVLQKKLAGQLNGFSHQSHLGRSLVLQKQHWYLARTKDMHHVRHPVEM